jgi:hypothetical protein
MIGDFRTHLGILFEVILFSSEGMQFGSDQEIIETDEGLDNISEREDY